MIHCIFGKNFDSNIYVVTGERNTVIDTGTGLHHEKVSNSIKEILDPHGIDQIVLTHEHYDHCGGVRKIFNLTHGRAKVMAHFLAAEKIEKGHSVFARMLGGEMPKMPVDKKLRDGEELLIGDEIFRVIHTPGHTPGSICLYSESSKTLFSGDTVFANGSFGRTDLPGGSSVLLKESIEFLSKLNVSNLYPGHDVFVEGDGSKHIDLSLKNVQHWM